MPADTWIACKLVLSCTGFRGKITSSDELPRREPALDSSHGLDGEHRLASPSRVPARFVGSLTAAIDEKQIADQVRSFLVESFQGRALATTTASPPQEFVETLAASVTDPFDDLALVCV